MLLLSAWLLSAQHGICSDPNPNLGGGVAAWRVRV